MSLDSRKSIADALGYFNVVDYGADPTGTNDSTAAINAAITAAAATPRQRIIYFPAGIYLTTGGHILDATSNEDGWTLMGPGGEGQAKSATAYIRIDPSTAQNTTIFTLRGYNFYTVKNLSVSYGAFGGDWPDNGDNFTAFKLYDSRQTLFDNVVVSQLTTGDCTGIHYFGREQFVLRNSLIGAKIPIRISYNATPRNWPGATGTEPEDPVVGGSRQAADIFTVQNTWLSGYCSETTPTGLLPHACVLVDGPDEANVNMYGGEGNWDSLKTGCRVRNLYLHESGGSAAQYCIYCNAAGSGNTGNFNSAVSAGWHLHNWGPEQLGQKATPETSWLVYYNGNNTTHLRNLRCETVTMTDNSCSGFYLRYVDTSLFDTCYLHNDPSTKVVDIDKFYSMEWQNFWTENDASMTLPSDAVLTQMAETRSAFPLPATARWVQNYGPVGTITPRVLGGIDRIFNVRDFGAKGDSTTDDRAAIQAAILAASGAHNAYDSGTVYFPRTSSYYKVDGTLYIPTDGVRFIGAGANSTQIVFTFQDSANTWTSPDGEKVGLLLVKSRNYIGPTFTATADATGSSTVLTDSGIRYVSGVAGASSSGNTLYNAGINTSTVSIGDMVANEDDTNKYAIVTDVQAGFCVTGNGTETDWVSGDNFTISNVCRGDMVRNNTTDAWGIAQSVAAGSITHTPLFGGSSTTWTTGDSFSIGGPPIIRYIEIKGVTLDTSDQTSKKVGIWIWDCGECLIQDIIVGYITNRRWCGTPGTSGADSCAVRVFGREFLKLDNYIFRGNVPLRFSYRDTRYTDNRPNSRGALSTDHFDIGYGGVWINSTNGADSTCTFSLPNACILVDDKVVMDNTRFERINGIRGDYFFYWDNPDPTAISQNVEFSNLRWEQTYTTALWNFYLSHPKYAVQVCSFSDVRFTGRTGSTVAGLYMDGVTHVSFNDCQMPWSTGPTIQVERTNTYCESIQWTNNHLASTSYFTINQSDLKLAWGYKTTGFNLPHTGLWTRFAGTGGAVTSLKLAVVTTTDLGNISHAINTTDKVAGAMVYASDNGLLYVATGSAATDPWNPSDGGTQIDP